jgi:hypothetical protein
LILLLTGCGTGYPGLQRIVEPNRPIHGRGFSVLPPAGENWRMKKASDWAVVFYWIDGQAFEGPGDSPAGSRRTFYVAALALDAPPEMGSSTDAFRRFIDDFASRPDPAGRIRNLSVKSGPTTLRGTPCVLVEAVQEEQGSPNDPLGDVLEMETRSYFCRHPGAATLIVSLAASERRPKGMPSGVDESLRRAAQDFFDSLRLTEVR